MIDNVIVVSTFLLATITLLPLFPSDHWACRSWEFPRVQISVLLVANLVLCLFANTMVVHLGAIVVNILLLSYQLLWIVPYTSVYPVEVPALSPNSKAYKLKIITSNVLMTNHEASKLLDLVKQYQPDILVTLESDSWWQEALEPLHEDYIHRVNQPLDNLYGMHVYSKHPLADVEVCYLIQENIPSVHCYLEIPNQPVIKCHFLHPAPPSPTENTEATPRDRELMLIARKVKPSVEPTIVTGDLNDVAWSPTTRAFRHKSKLLDPRIGRGFYNTFHADYFFARWPLDHVFHSAHFEFVALKRLPSIGSDHFPLYSELGLKNDCSR